MVDSRLRNDFRPAPWVPSPVSSRRGSFFVSPVWFLSAMMALNLAAALLFAKQRNFPDAWVFLTYGLSYIGFIARHLGGPA